MEGGGEAYIRAEGILLCEDRYTLPVVVIDEEKTLKTGIYIIPNFYFILFGKAQYIGKCFI